MKLQELRSKKKDIHALAAAHGASRIRVFGSVARGEETSNSDVDFLVDLPQGYDIFRVFPHRSLFGESPRTPGATPSRLAHSHVQHQTRHLSVRAF